MGSLPFADIKDQKRMLKTYLKVNHQRYDNHRPFDPFSLKSATLDPTNIKIKKHFNFMAGIQEEYIDYLHNPYKPAPLIAYFQPVIYRSVGIRENRGKTINYNNMINKLGWNL